jgi:hypothetical protein
MPPCRPAAHGLPNRGPLHRAPSAGCRSRAEKAPRSDAPKAPRSEAARSKARRALRARVGSRNGHAPSASAAAIVDFVGSLAAVRGPLTELGLAFEHMVFPCFGRIRPQTAQGPLSGHSSWARSFGATIQRSGRRRRCVLISRRVPGKPAYSRFAVSIRSIREASTGAVSLRTVPSTMASAAATNSRHRELRSRGSRKQVPFHEIPASGRLRDRTRKESGTSYPRKAYVDADRLGRSAL